MKNLDKLPVFYQNAKVIELDDTKQEEQVDKRNLVHIPFYQSKLHVPDLHYKPISKIWTLKDE